MMASDEEAIVYWCAVTYCVDEDLALDNERKRKEDDPQLNSKQRRKQEETAQNKETRAMVLLLLTLLSTQR